MRRPSLTELEQQCQKPDHRRIGNWMARRVARPLALRVTWVLVPYGISAHAMTLVAWLTGLCAVALFAWDGPEAMLAGAVVLQLWYLLDHVDGQLARYHGTASLDGVQLDYLMHHMLSLLVPIGVGVGAAVSAVDPLWAMCGLVWGVASLLIGLMHDARYKAFIQRLKRVRGELIVIGGGGASPQPQPGMPRRFLPLAVWLARKACEIHVVMNVLVALAALQFIAPQIVNAYLGLMTCTSLALASVLLVRSIRRHDAEHEFARWFRVPNGHDLVFHDGWWHVVSQQVPGLDLEVAVDERGGQVFGKDVE